MEGKSHRYQVKALTDEENAKQKKVFKNFKNGYHIRVGPAGYVLPTAWLDHSEAIRTAPIRPDDVFVVSCPRSGTTWTQELVWLVANDMNFDKAKSLPLIYRFPFLEFSLFEESIKSLQACPERLEETRTMAPPPSLKDLASSPSPRFMKSHLPLSLLPEGFLDTAKVVYVARDPRDVAVSFYYFWKNLPYLGMDALFKEFWELFINDLAPWNPHLAHVKEAWQQRHHPNMLFLFYEELSKDLGAVARRVAGFLGKQYTDEQYDALLDHLKIDNFRKNNAVNREYKILEADKFIRKGKAGGWRDEFDEGMTEDAERWMTERLRGTGLTFQ